MTIVLALTAAFCVGVSNALGGVASRSRRPIEVAALVQVLGFALLLPVAILYGATHTTVADVVFGAAGGLMSGLGYLALYMAIAKGRISLVAPLAAFVTVLCPVAVGLATGDSLARLAAIGMVIGIASIPLLGYESAADTAESTAVWPLSTQLKVAVLAGLGWGGWDVLLGQTSTDSGLWPAVAGLLMAGIVASLVALATGGFARSMDRLTLAAGLGLAPAAACFTLALQRGPLSIAAVLGNLYPLVTAVFGWLVFKERLRAPNVVGIGLATLAVVMIAAA